MNNTATPEKIDLIGEKITINRTIDGKPFDTLKKRKSKSSKNEDGNKNEQVTARLKSDPYIWGIYILLVIVAIIELFSASTTEVAGNNVYAPLVRHGGFLVLGLVIILGLQKIHYGYISRFAEFFTLVSMGMLAFADLWGANINGAQRAIMVAGITIQPAEIVKISIVIILAKILGRNQTRRGVKTRGIILVGLVVALFAGLTIKNGLTNMVIIMGVSISMMLIGGIPMKKLMMVFAIYAVIGGGAYMIKEQADKQNEFDLVAQEGINGDDVAKINLAEKAVDRSELREGRIKQWLKGVHPDDKMTDNNRQQRLSYMAQARGATFGKGPGNSRESARLPLAFSDYIFSIIVEDTGLAGGVALMLIYLCLVGRAGVLAYRCKHAFPAFLVMGSAVLVVFQALVHMAIVTGAFPVSGQPLPLISKGGTSVLVMSAAFGIMLSVSRHAAKIKDPNESTPLPQETLPEELTAVNITTYNES